MIENLKVGHIFVFTASAPCQLLVVEGLGGGTRSISMIRRMDRPWKREQLKKGGIMEIIEAHSAWLSNFEVLKHLRLQKDERDQISVNIGRPVRTAENVQTLEFEARPFSHSGW